MLKIISIYQILFEIIKIFRYQVCKAFLTFGQEVGISDRA